MKQNDKKTVHCQNILLHPFQWKEDFQYSLETLESKMKIHHFGVNLLVGDLS